jgi:hypothetical protein
MFFALLSDEQAATLSGIPAVRHLNRHRDSGVKLKGPQRLATATAQSARSLAAFFLPVRFYFALMLFLV